MIIGYQPLCVMGVKLMGQQAIDAVFGPAAARLHSVHSAFFKKRIMKIRINQIDSVKD